MVEVFRLEIARVSLSLGSNDDATQKEANRNGSRHYPKVNEFVELKATVVNLTRKFFKYLINVPKLTTSLQHHLSSLRWTWKQILRNISSMKEF